ncbi:MAG TPA: questin oxidase family protein [Candidatus Binataceae bacterium]|nr:questin oxidase family protein [Candidatus Binataceae bacterium]
MIGSYESIDEALEMLSGCGPETIEGFSNHGPMAAEALCAMDRSDVVVAWVDRYRKRVAPRQITEGKIKNNEWRDALGEHTKFSAWASFFEEELKDATWQVVLDKWAARLAPGIAAAAFHGVLRTAHATRSLADDETPQRRAELAQGLAYWAAEFQPLNPKMTGGRGLGTSRAIAAVPLLPPELRRTHGSITDALAPVIAYPAFADVHAMIDSSKNVGELLSDLSATFAGVFEANAIGITPTIALIHCVTGPSCVRMMISHVSDSTARTCASHAWHAAAAIYSTYASKPWSATDAEESSGHEMPADELIGRAVHNGDEHAIKFTEACIREAALNPQAVYARAASKAIATLPPVR